MPEMHLSVFVVWYGAQVLSPATIAAIDLATLNLLDLPGLVAFILGVLADEFSWIAKSFPQPFSVRFSLPAHLHLCMILFVMCP